MFGWALLLAANVAPHTSPSAAATWSAQVSEAPSRTESWVWVTLQPLGADTPAPTRWLFEPTPLVRQIHVAPGGRCVREPEHAEIVAEDGGQELELALRIGPGTEGVLRLGRLRGGSTEQILEVTLREQAKQPHRPRRFRPCEVAPASEQSPRPVSLPSSCDLSDAFIVLDPGHGPGEHPGALSARGTREYVFNDALAREVRRALLARAPLRVELTRDPDRDRTLRSRVSRVNRERPDLLLSLHHDSVAESERKAVVRDGVEVRSCKDHYGFSLYLDTVDEHARASYHAARRLSDRLMAAGRPVGRFFYWGQLERGIYNGDVLYLLRNADAPAVLLENGFICNYDEERRLLRPRARRELGQLIAEAILEFLVERRCEEPPSLDATGVIYALD